MRYMINNFHMEGVDQHGIYVNAPAFCAKRVAPTLENQLVLDRLLYMSTVH